MEPLKASVKTAILQNRPNATPEELEEYERLLGEGFTTDPDLPKAPDAIVADQSREKRLEKLYRKLFGP